MVDINDYLVQEGEAYTHVMTMDGGTMYLHLDPLDTDLLEDITTITNDEDGHLHEYIGDICIPYVGFSDDPAVGAQFMGAIMKRLYNSYSPIAALHNPSGDGYIIVAPYARVNDDMLKEIQDTFQVLCKHKGIPYVDTGIDHLPLTWEVTAYKEGSEIDTDVAFPEDIAPTLSAMATEQKTSNKVKMNASRAKRMALVDSILMHSHHEIQGDMAKARDIVSMISRDRSKDMSLFLTIGKCLYKVFKGDGEGLDLWRSITVAEKQDMCDTYYPTLDTTGTYYTVRTLQKWAKEDSPDDYKEWNSTSIRAYLEASVMSTGGVADVAGVGYHKDPSIFICEGDEPKEAQFYRFNGTYYQPCGSFQVQDYLEREVVPEYDAFIKDLSGMQDSNPDNNFQLMIQGKIDNCIKIIKSLKDDAYQMKVVKILMRRYNKPGFDKIRDHNPYLTAFEDCVLDLSPGMISGNDMMGCLRKGIPEDYITCSTGYPFMDIANEYSWDHEDVRAVLDAYGRLEMNPDKLVMIRRQIASSLYASNLRKRKLIITGPTNNGKSMLCTWWSKALGPTYYPSDVGNNLLYATDINPNAPTPSLDAVRFSRVLLQSEITDQHIMNEGLVKRLTGKVDSIAGRGMYARKMKSFIPKCTPVTCCNSFPKINGNSAALRTRLLVYTMSSKFITPTDPEWEQVKDLSPEDRDAFMREHNWFHADLNFDSVINRTYKAFMWVMIQDYLKYHLEDPKGIVAPGDIPMCVMKDTMEYFIRSNIYLQFIKQACKKTPGVGAVTTYAMYSAYKKWFSENVSRFGMVPYAKFLEELESMGVKPYNDMFNGMTITYQ